MAFDKSRHISMWFPCQRKILYSHSIEFETFYSVVPVPVNYIRLLYCRQSNISQLKYKKLTDWLLIIRKSITRDANVKAQFSCTHQCTVYTGYVKRVYTSTTHQVSSGGKNVEKNKHNQNTEQSCLTYIASVQTILHVDRLFIRFSL